MIVNVHFFHISLGERKFVNQMFSHSTVKNGNMTKISTPTCTSKANQIDLEKGGKTKSLLARGSNRKVT